MREPLAISVHSTPVKDVRALKWSILGRDRSLPHLGRKFYHMLMGVICFSLYAFVLTREEALLALLLVGGTWVLFDIVRLQVPPLNHMALRVFGKVMRREELSRISA